MSPLDQALLINGVVLAAVLEADLGPHRKVSWFRIARPLLLAGAIVPIYLTTLATRGTGLVLEIAGAVAGIVLGLVATALLTVYRSDRTGKPVSQAGWPYAALWITVIGARTAFSYGAGHWFGPQLAHWMIEHQVGVGAITDTLIIMAVGMLVARTAGLAGRASALPRASARSQANLHA